MFCTIIVFVLLFNSILSQSVFDPPTFTAVSCPSNYYWTSWFDTNDPTLAQADMELTSHIQQLFGSFMCSYPMAIEVCSIFCIIYYSILFFLLRLKQYLIQVQQQQEMYFVLLRKMDFYV